MTQNLPDNLRIGRDKPLAKLTTMGVGGNAQYYATVETTDDVGLAFRWSQEQSVPLRVLSGGSNLIIADQGVTGLVVDLRLRGLRYEVDGDAALVTVAAGEDWDSFVADAVGRGLSGLECLSGIPGRVGASPIQNIGAYGQDVAQTICQLTSFDRKTGTIINLQPDECEFGYRTSRFKNRQPDRHIILAVCFRLQDKPPRVPQHSELMRQLILQDISVPTVRDIRNAVLSLRRSKSMLFDPADPVPRSCGSFFVNPVVPAHVALEIKARFASENVPLYSQSSGSVKIAAAWLIEKSGFQRGYQAGAVGLSSKHSLALVAHADATARDVVLLAQQIQMSVRKQFGVELIPEPVFWGFSRMNGGLPDVSFE